MELKQATARITDDPAGVVGPGDDLDRAGECLVRDGVYLSWIRRRDRRLQVVDGRMHLPTVRVRRAPPGEVRSSPDQREDSVGERGHSTDSLQSLTDTSPSRCPTGHTRIGEGDLLPHDLQRGWAGFVGSPWEGGLIVGDDLVGSIVRGFGGGPGRRSGANAS